jgi:hypothetical protein
VSKNVVIGEKELQAFLSKFADDIADGLDGVADATGLVVKSEIQKGYHAHASAGNVYTHEILGQLPNGHLVEGKRRAKPHVASAPGFAPNSDTGDLAKFIAVEKTDPGVREVAPYGFAEKYGAWLEWGTREILPRPLWRPVRDKAEPVYKQMVEDFLIKKANDASR